ncbi:MAG: gluconate 2-dehydrogenase subunit 3 family protein [Vicinamibacterales bacterium]
MSTTAITRREALRAVAIGAGAVAGASLLSEAAWAQAVAVRRQAAAKPAQGLQFFSAAEHRTVDTLAELIIPADDHSAGAKAAKVADFIDLLLTGVIDEEKTLWHEGLTELDAQSTARFRRPFAEAPVDRQVAFLTEISQNEADPTTVLERLFVRAKERTVQGYYTSEIGLLKELSYKGNQFQSEFHGCTHPEHLS